MEWLPLQPLEFVLAITAALTLGGFLGFFLRAWVDERQQQRRKRALEKLLASGRPAAGLFAGRAAPRTAPAAEARTPIEPQATPRWRAAAAPAAPLEPVPDAPAGRPEVATILVVDDRLELRAVHAAYLEGHGYRVLQAGDGDSALAAARRHHPAAILLDHSLPKRTGLEVARELKSESATADIPIVFMTAHSYGAVGGDAIAAGCAAFLPKPCEPSRVLKEIMRLTPPTPTARA